MSTANAVAFIDASVTDYQTLIDGNQEGLQQIADWAANHNGYGAIHILSHGSAGQVQPVVCSEARTAPIAIDAVHAVYRILTGLL